MATQEFYIRNPDDEEARGPFALEQLQSLAENGQVTLTTLYYEADSEEWRKIDTNDELKAGLFPEKRKLRVKAKEVLNTLNTADDSAPPISVNDMLAAAEGRTEDTKDKSAVADSLALASKVGLISVALVLVTSAAGFLAPNLDLLTSLDWPAMVKNPWVIFGVADLVLGLFMILQMVALYPMIRFRSALGAGFLGLVYWTQGETQFFLATVATSVCLYLLTIVTNAAFSFLVALCGLAGAGGFVYLQLMS